MEKFIKNYWKNSMISSILIIMVAFVLMLKPAEALYIAMIFFGVSIFMVGIGHIISFVFKEDDNDVFNFEFLEGVLYMFFGLLIGYNPSLVLNSINLIVGVWIIINALIRLQIALNISTDKKGQMWIIALSMLSFVFGVLIVSNPAEIATAVPFLIGGFLLYSEVINIVEYLCLIKNMKLIKKAVKKK